MCAWIKKKEKKRDWSRNKITDKTKAVKKIYQTKNWKELRKAYFMEHPLCEECLKNGIIKPTEEIHHKIPISTGNDDNEMKTLAFDSDNLMALCEECHHKVHKELGSGFLKKSKRP